jgi:hypothetical protein
VEPLPVVVLDGGAQILEVAPGAAALSLPRSSLALAPSSVIVAQRAGYLIEGSLAEELQQPAGALTRLHGEAD